MGIDLPANYRFTYRIRGQGPRNTVEFKLLDPSGDNVWWVNQRDFEFTADWREIVLPKRKVSFAWGPAGAQTPLSRVEHLEIAITASSGGKGTVWIDDLRFEPLPEARPYTATPVITTSSNAGEATALWNGGTVAWTSDQNDATPTITIDFGEVRELGGVVLEWSQAPSEGVTVRTDPGSAPDAPGGTRSWSSPGRSSPGRQYLPIANLTARTIQITAHGGPVSLSGVRFMPPEFGEDRNRVLGAAAADAPRGWFPRYFLGEAMYFTVAGASGDTREALVSEDGAVEIDKQSLTIEPFLVESVRDEASGAAAGRLRSWADARISHDLIDGELPMPIVTREHEGLHMTTTAWVDGEAGASVLVVRHTVRNARKEPAHGELVIAMRPMQVNPTYQNLNMDGGWARVGRIAATRGAGGDLDAIAVDRRVLLPVESPKRFQTSAWAEGEIVERLAGTQVPGREEVVDALELASVAMWHEYALGAGESRSWHVLVPMHDPAPIMEVMRTPARRAAYASESFERVRDQWRERLGRVRLELPDHQERIVRSIRANLAYILINRDGPAIQPGSRCYERTWIRDGSLTSAALLSFGFEREVKEFLDWFAPFQYDNGKIPCCADHRGPDPVPEHDSHGQYIYAVKHVFDMTGDSDFLARHYPRMLKAVEYMEFLRAQRMTAEFRDAPEGDLRRAKFGILPESISHEGYSAKPMHSYWDNFFAYKGIADAADTAELLGDRENASRLAALRDEFLASVQQSLARATAIKGIDFLPGCVELGDFDATSTTIALQPCGMMRLLDPVRLERTFERAWANFVTRRDSAVAWRDYTPYEHRVVGSMVLLGHRQRALEMLDFFFADQRPSVQTGSAGGGGFRHWAEVVFREPRKQGYVGDMPHTWCGSDFINSVTLMLAHADQVDGRETLVLGAGLPRSWVTDPKGVRVDGLRMPSGTLRLHIRRDQSEHSAIYELGPLARPPAGGAIVSLPDPERVRSVQTSTGQAVEVRNGRARIEPGIPLRVVWEP